MSDTPTAATCMYCNTAAPVASATRAAPCPGCGRAVQLLSGDTPFKSVVSRAKAYRDNLNLRGTFVLQTAEAEGGRIRAIFSLQPPGATGPEDCTVFVDEEVDPPVHEDWRDLPPLEQLARANAAATFRRHAWAVHTDLGGVAVLDFDGLRPVGGAR